jgi:hypothetical protein
VRFVFSDLSETELKEAFADFGEVCPRTGGGGRGGFGGGTGSRRY